MHILLISGFIIAALLIILLVPKVEHGDTSEPISRSYYIKSEEDKSWLEKFIGDPIAMFTFILTGATLGLYVSTFRLWNATERLVKGADDTARRQLRAYIGVEKYEFDIKRHMLNVFLKNGGQTPAHNLRVGGNSIRFDISRTEPAEDFDIPKWLDETAQREFSVIPGKTFRFETFADKEDWEFLNDGRSHILIYAVINYHDIFGIAHFIRLCIHDSRRKEGFILAPFWRWNDGD